jgi:DNA anti-recombination protein RmuC
MSEKRQRLSVEVTLKDMPGHIAQAFEWYYNQGGERSLRAVAKETGKSNRTVYRWSKLYDWQYRVEERDKKIAKSVANQNEMDIIAEKSAMLKRVDGLLKPIHETIERLEKSSKGLTVTNLEELERLTRSLERLQKLRLQLLGEASGADVEIKIQLPEDVSMDDL